MASIDDLWLVDLGEPHPGEPAAHRPALVLGPPDSFGPAFPFVIVTPLTTTRRGLSLHIEVEPTEESGLDETSYIQSELLRSINRKRLARRLGTIDVDTSLRVSSVVKTLLNY
ncbi:MAG TPA: type II toxin-antitoxin system PemK/MazF family toxin [Acidimicrobiia bacterium]